MNRLIGTILFLALMGFALVVSAQPPAKSTILHCGCNLAGNDMEYVEINVNSKSRGHDAHLAGTWDSCFDGVDTYTDVMRTGDDCQLSGPPLGDPILACDGPAEFDDCGVIP